MHKTLLSMLIVTALAASPALWAAGAADAIHTMEPSGRMVPPGQDQTGAYVTLHNADKRDHALVKAESPAARATELHTVVDEGGIEEDAPGVKLYEEKVIPYWSGRSMRDRMFEELPEDWKAAYGAGIFTEFMEQRAPGHTVLDDKIYSRGLLDFRRDIEDQLGLLSGAADPAASGRREELRAMGIAIDAVVALAVRHADAARDLASAEGDPARREELKRIEAVCRRVPAHAPRDFHEAIQAYWFVHLGVITELNPWDAFNPVYLDRHLYPFYAKGLEDGTLTATPSARPG